MYVQAYSTWVLFYVALSGNLKYIKRAKIFFSSVFEIHMKIEDIFQNMIRHICLGILVAFATADSSI